MNRPVTHDARGIPGCRSLRMMLLCLVLDALCLPVVGEDWPTYHHDIARTAINSESLSLPLNEHWSFATSGEPVPGWAPPQSVPVEGYLELPRAQFDDVYHPVVADGTVYFGSSAENKVYALDAATGEVRWTVFTGGAVRLAPAVWEGRVYFGADDGCIYCVQATDGELVWKFRAAPGAQRLLGRGRMVSLWPIRTGLVVDDGTVYCTAGIFPGERVYMYALRAEDGAVVWKNDSISFPSGGGSSRHYGISPQGYLLASPKKLYVPSGRNAPAVFDRASGRLMYQLGSAWGKSGLVGGTYALLVGDRIYSGTGELTAYGGQSGRSGLSWFPGRRLVVTTGFAYMLADTGVCALDREKYPEASRKRQALKSKRASVTRARPADLDEQLKALDQEQKDADELIAASRPWLRELAGFESMILAGNALFVGGEGQVLALDAATGETRWTGAINGVAKGLAAADGRLLVSTDDGTIYCFAPGPQPRREQLERQPPAPYPRDRLTPVYEAAADAILEESGIDRGFCLVLGCGTGRLALELAQRTEDLMIYGVEPDAGKVAAARKALAAAGVYGTRVCVDQAELSSVPYSDYFANLIVSEDALVSDGLRASPEEALRMLKPHGGVVCIGQPAAAKGIVKPVRAAMLQRWLRAGDMSGYQMSEAGGTWAKFVHGPVAGSDDWTHQYGEPGNAGSSQDTAVKCPLGMLWFGDPGPDVAVNRHRGTAAPLVVNGRTFLQGNNYIVAFDPYNGVKFWERDIPGAYRVNMARDCSNLAATEDSLFVATGMQCLRLDAATGETVATYDMPPPPDDTARTWAYVAVVGDILVGSTQQRGLYSDAVFALDVNTGALRWAHQGKTIKNNAICVSDSRVLFVEGSVTPEQRQEGLGDTVRRVAAEKGISIAEAEKQIPGADVRVAMALDLASGRTLWEKPVDVTDCGGDVLVGMCNRGVYAFAGAHKDGHYWPQFLGGEFAPRRVVAISAEDGSLLWSKAVGYRMRPIIVGDTLYAEPWAFDLRTGKQKLRTNPVTGASSIWEFERPGHHCGAVSGSPNALFFRSGSIAYYDLVTDHGTEHFGGQRAGCWINIIPANGLVVVPEASSGCVCLYSIHCTTVFKPRALNRAWAIYDATGDLTPVRHMGINLGAPGDRRDTEGTLWLSYPRPSGRMRVNFDLGVAPGAAPYFTTDTEYTQIAGTDAPWIFASGCSGMSRCAVPVLREEDGAAIYTVRLGFADTENQAPGERVFDIKLQGEVVEENFDIV
ncbi:MAG: PQQ-binding-like beta-propeller repeat protein, partial [Armatimonadota bacterium]